MWRHGRVKGEKREEGGGRERKGERRNRGRKGEERKRGGKGEGKRERREREGGRERERERKGEGKKGVMRKGSEREEKRKRRERAHSDRQVLEGKRKLCTFAACNNRYTAWLAADAEYDWSLDPGDQKVCPLSRHSWQHPPEPIEDHCPLPAINCGKSR